MIEDVKRIPYGVSNFVEVVEQIAEILRFYGRTLIIEVIDLD